MEAMKVYLIRLRSKQIVSDLALRMTLNELCETRVQASYKEERCTLFYVWSPSVANSRFVSLKDKYAGESDVLSSVG